MKSNYYIDDEIPGMEKISGIKLVYPFYKPIKGKLGSKTLLACLAYRWRCDLITFENVMLRKWKFDEYQEEALNHKILADKTLQRINDIYGAEAAFLIFEKYKKVSLDQYILTDAYNLYKAKL